MFAVQGDRFLEWFAQGALAYSNLGRVVCAYHPLPYDDVLCDSRLDFAVRHYRLNARYLRLVTVLPFSVFRLPSSQAGVGKSSLPEDSSR
jgi:hypothetical protein